MAKTVHRPEYRRLVTILRERRESLGVPQGDLARALGKGQAFVSDVERAERRLDVVQFLDVCAALELDPGSVLGQLRHAGPKGLRQRRSKG